MSVFMVFWKPPTLFIGMNTGVYKIENITNGKVYVGSTATLGFRKRWGLHRASLRANKHPNQHLQYSWNKHGEQSFKFEIVEECPPAQCIIREQHYFDAFHPEYNILQIAGSCRGYRHTDIAKQKIGEASHGKNHPLYSGKYVFYHPIHGYFNGGLFELSDKFGMRKGVGYRLQNGELDKSHGWIYIGKYPCDLSNDIDAFYHNRVRNNRPTYSFYHQEKGMFVGTLPEFMRTNKIHRKNHTTVLSLVRGKRKMAWGWIFVGEGKLQHSPNVDTLYAIAFKQNTKANNRMDTIHHFSNFKTGEYFRGTLRELVKTHNLNDGTAREMLGGRKAHLKGWTIKS